MPLVILNFISFHDEKINTVKSSQKLLFCIIV